MSGFEAGYDGSDFPAVSHLKEKFIHLWVLLRDFRGLEQGLGACWLRHRLCKRIQKAL